jgi:hypothetical protein
MATLRACIVNQHVQAAQHLYNSFDQDQELRAISKVSLQWDRPYLLCHVVDPGGSPNDGNLRTTIDQRLGHGASQTSTATGD